MRNDRFENFNRRRDIPKSTLIPAAVKRSYLKALDIVSAQAKKWRRKDQSSLGPIHWLRTKRQADKLHDGGAGGQDGYDYA